MQKCICFVLCLLVSAAQGLADTPESQQGWATEGKGTTGGAAGEEFQVATADALVSAMKSDQPKTIRIMSAIKLKEALRVTSNTTLLGQDTTTKITGNGLHLRRVHNVILQDLVIAEAPDAINIEESHHIWIDHCDLSNCGDGLIDIKRGSDFITVSWNHLHDHHKTCLLGHSDKDDIRQLDLGHLRVTYHHNYFDGTKTRHPRVRFAEGVHVFNNYYRMNEYGVASLMDAGVMVESNVFEDVEQPTLIAYGDSPDPGRLTAKNNQLIRSGKIETRGTVDPNTLNYEYTVDPVGSIPQLVAGQAGVRPNTH